MLKLVDIKKDYVMSDETVHALKGVSVNFRRNEFVAILGQSGCGKTTLLNIVGGLDRYSDGDLVIEGKSTKDYKDSDWDTYRNHSIGFIFQSYNLISHINILKNVELALTLSGIDKKERKKRAEQALEMVGLKGQGRKKPNQLSGGQMQRVAIARALINNPEIVLADEPTGALDSETSVQIMELLKNVAKDRLVVMVTHNPDLAKQYATRIITMKDGLLTHDSNPYDGETKEELSKVLELKKANKEEQSKGKKKQSSMGFLTALALSFTNLMTKKARTFLISFAGSIGIIGIAMISSISFAMNNYIYEVQTNSMSSYPLMALETQNDQNMVAMFMGSANEGHALDKYSDSTEIHENSSMSSMLSKALSVKHTDIGAFKRYLEQPEIAKKFEAVTSDITFSYGRAINIFATKTLDGKEPSEPIRLSPIHPSYKDSYIYDADTYRHQQKDELEDDLIAEYKKYFKKNVNAVFNALNMVNGNPFGRLLDNEELLESQFDVLKGHLPQNVNEVVVKLNKYNEIPDVFLYGMGLKDISYMISQFVYGQMINQLPAFPKAKEHEDIEKFQTTFDDIMNLEFSIVTNSQYYAKEDAPDSELGYRYKSIYNSSIPTVTPEATDMVKKAMKLKVVGIVRPKESVQMTSFESAIGYHPDLFEYLSKETMEPTPGTPFANATVLQDQIAHPSINMMTGNKFPEGKQGEMLGNNLNYFGYVDLMDPSSVYIYPKDFASKAKIMELVDEYNSTLGIGSENELKRIQLIDNIGTMLDSVQIIVDSVSYVLIAFVSISLIVSSIMIGIITYVSVLERTKEIGILRSIGARKKDISRVFNAETLIIGLVAGLLGIAIASLLNIPVMLIINALTDVNLLIIIPWYGAIALPVISVLLTIVSGLIPSSIASKRDPVIALRTE